jgi:electron transfer flavoprotein alpha subunit
MSVLILAEHEGQQLKQATRQAVSAAQSFGMPVTVLVLGHQAEVVAQQAARIAGVTQVLWIDAPRFAHPLAEDVAPLLVRLANEYQVLLAAHTAFAKNTLPRVAALLDVAMVSDVVRIVGPKQYTRPIYAGNVLASVESGDAIQVLTIRASSFDAAAEGGAAPVSRLEAQLAEQDIARWVGEQRTVSDRPELASARVVVSGGRALGSSERFQSELGPLAAKLGAALGATRAAVDEGMAPNDLQVGQTGTVVAPELYIAVGVSGAVQHLAGMKDSKVIVAINKDPDAPIFQVADYGLVADLFEVLPQLEQGLA